MSEPDATAAPFIPELQLGSVETGGGWGLGEQFARLPPASVQAESRIQLYTVARGIEPLCGSAANDSDDEIGGQTPAPGVAETPTLMPTTHYSPTPADDDNTFVDHGSSGPSLSPLMDASAQNVGGAPHGNSAGANHTQQMSAVQTHVPLQLMHQQQYQHQPQPQQQHQHQQQQQQQQQHQQPQPQQQLQQQQQQLHQQNPARGQRSSQAKFSRPVSRMIIKDSVRAMVVAPDGASLIAAFGDNSVSVLEFKGVELTVSRTVEVTNVYAMEVVRVPAAKAVSFKSASRMPSVSMRISAPVQATSYGEGEESCVLWCGINRGSIAIVDLSDFSSAGVINNAHTQTISGLWYLGNSKVWSAGNDKALRVWDPQTRRRMKSRNIATIISDLCYVSSIKQVWAISDDTFIRIFDLTGNNLRAVKQSNDKPENTLRMRSEPRFIMYYELGDMIYVSLSRGGLIAIDPTSNDTLNVINVTLTSMSFVGSTALVTGYGELLQCGKESIGLFDLSNPVKPVLLFRGGVLDGAVTPVGMRLLTGVPLAVAAQDGCRKENFLTVFNYEDSKAFGRGGQLVSVPQQRKITVNSNQRRQPGVPGHTNAVSSNALSTPYCASHTNSNNYNNISGGPVHHPVVFATDKRGGGMPWSRDEAVIAHAGSGSGRQQQQQQQQQRTTVVSSSSRLDGAWIYQNSHSMGNNVNGAAERNTSAPPMATPPELMASLTNIEKKTEDLKALFAQMRASRPLLDDFSSVHALVSRLAMDGQLGPPLDTDGMDTIEREYQTLEGRVIASAVERLRCRAAQPHSHPQAASTCGAAALAASGRSSSSRNGRLSARATPRSGLCELDELRLSGVSEDSAGDKTSESLMRWVMQITRSGQAEREAHRRQIESLQRHNTRIVERNAAFISGLARVEQALRTHAQRLLEEADAAAVPSEMSDSSSHVHSQRHVQQLNQSLQQIEQVSVSSTPKEISAVMGNIITLASRLLIAQQCVHGDDGARRALNELSSACNTGDFSGRIPNGGGSSVLRFAASSPRPTAVDVLSMRPQRMLSVIADQVSTVEEFVKDVGRFWCCLEETQRVIYIPYDGGALPDLTQDFMQFAVLWHLRETQVIVDLCRKESVVVMAEALLSDLEGRDSVREDNSGSPLPRTIAQTGTAPTAAIPYPADGAAMPTASALSSSVAAGKSTSLATATTAAAAAYAGTGVVETTTSIGIRPTTMAEQSTRLVGVGLELEAAATRIRSSFDRTGRNLSKGTPRSLIGGLFNIPAEKLVADLPRLRGMLHWQCVTIHLLFECLETFEDLIFHVDEQPRAFRRDNFRAMEQQLDDWRAYLEDVHGEATQLLSVIILSQSEDRTVPQRAASSHVRRSSPGTDDAGRGSEVGDGVPATGERTTQWVLLVGLYVKCIERTGAAPVLFESQDTGDDVGAADFGLMALLDHIAETVEAVRAKSSALLRYCQKIQGRLPRIVGDATLHEETGAVLIPAWRGGHIAERYCKGFCHDMS